jgi:hypothetical protein
LVEIIISVGPNTSIVLIPKNVIDHCIKYKISRQGNSVNEFGLKLTSVGVFSNSIVVVNKDLRYNSQGFNQSEVVIIFKPGIVSYRKKIT